MSAAHDASFRFEFPQVLKRRDWARNIRPSDIASEVIADAREAMGWYFRANKTAARYERAIHESWNLDRPHSLTKRNFSNAILIGSRGRSPVGATSIIDRELPEFERTPIDADLFTEGHEENFVALVKVIRPIRSVAITYACKLFYQKRRSLVPILEGFVRDALNVAWYATAEEVVRRAITRIRIVAEHGPNSATLKRLRQWLADNPKLTSGVPLSPVRLIDILAWSLTYRCKTLRADLRHVSSGRPVAVPS
jgi:hypothetical protein